MCTMDKGQLNVIEKGEIALELNFENGSNILDSNFSEDISNMVNKVKVYKDNEEHTIYKCDLQWYLENGWHIGRNPNNKKSLALSETAKNASSGKGKKIIHNKELQQIKRVNPNELQYYLSIGWERGYLNK